MQEDAGKVQDLFLYSRAHLRPSAVLPPAEALPPLEPDLSGVEAIRTQRHRLDAASSPLLRALPDYLRQFQEHLLTAAARHDACQHRCVQHPATWGGVMPSPGTPRACVPSVPLARILLSF